MPIDLKHVESFVAVAETLSFSTAATRTNTVQSAVSMHVKALERQVNRTLVHRGRGKPVALTAEGAAFLVQARRLLLLADQVANPQGRLVEPEPLRLGTTVTFALSIMPRNLRAFASQTGASPVTVRTARSHDLMDLLEAGQIDIALVYDQGAHPLRQFTVQTNLSWVASRSFVQGPDAPLPLAFLEDARDLRRHAFTALDEVGEISASLSVHPDPVGLRAFVAAGLAVTVLPEIAIVVPFADVTASLGLPALGTMPVSIYAGTGHAGSDLKHFTQVLAAGLQAAP